MAAPDTTKLRRILADLLDSAAGCMTDTPARRFISAAEPSAPFGLNCSQLAVHFQNLRTVAAQTSDNPPTAATKIRVATLVVTLHWPVCMSPDPTAAQHNTDGVAFTDALYELYAGLLYLHDTKAMLPNFPAPSTLTRGSLVLSGVAVDREGGLAKGQVTVDVTL